MVGFKAMQAHYTLSVLAMCDKMKLALGCRSMKLNPESKEKHIIVNIKMQVSSSHFIRINSSMMLALAGYIWLFCIEDTHSVIFFLARVKYVFSSKIMIELLILVFIYENDQVLVSLSI